MDRRILTVGAGILLLLFGGAESLPAARKGSQVEVTRIDGQIVQGELLRVRADHILVYYKNASQEWNIPLETIARVKVKKRSLVWPGVILGVAIGLVRAVDENSGPGPKELSPLAYMLYPPKYALVLGGLGFLYSLPVKAHFLGCSAEEHRLLLSRLAAYARDRQCPLPPLTVPPVQAAAPPTSDGASGGE